MEPGGPDDLASLMAQAIEMQQGFASAQQELAETMAPLTAGLGLPGLPPGR